MDTTARAGTPGVWFWGLLLSRGIWKGPWRHACRACEAEKASGNDVQVKQQSVFDVSGAKVTILAKTAAAAAATPPLVPATIRMAPAEAIVPGRPRARG